MTDTVALRQASDMLVDYGRQMQDLRELDRQPVSVVHPRVSEIQGLIGEASLLIQNSGHPHAGTTASRLIINGAISGPSPAGVLARELRIDPGATFHFRTWVAQANGAWNAARITRRDVDRMIRGEGGYAGP